MHSYFPATPIVISIVESHTTPCFPTQPPKQTPNSTYHNSHQNLLLYQHYRNVQAHTQSKKMKRWTNWSRKTMYPGNNLPPHKTPNTKLALHIPHISSTQQLII